jgi:sulfite reductase (ferredoxin)
MPYTIPDSLNAEIDGLESAIRRYQAGQLEAAALKAQRVPFGVYEQRTPAIFMVRIRCTGGTLTPRQLAGAAQLARSHGSGLLHLTSRQDLQIHGVDLDHIIDLQRRLKDLGLSSRGGGGNTVRNIMASPEADPAAPFAVGPWVDALTDRVIREADSWTLPRKFKIAFSDTDADTALAGFNDLGFFARLGPQGQPGFKVYAAGGLGGQPRTALPFYDFIPAPEVHLVVTAVKRFFDRNGNRRNRRQARLRFLRDRFGDEGLIAQLRAEVDALRAAGFPQLDPAPYRPRITPEPAIPPVEAPAGLEAWKRLHVIAEGTSGRSSVLLPIPLGDLQAEAALAIAQAIEPFGDQALRLEQRQNLRLVGIPDSHLGAAFTRLRELLDFSPATRFISRAVACTGADTCKLGLCLPKGAVRELHRLLAGADLDLAPLAGFRLHISGCPNSCAQHLLADLGCYGLAQRKGQHVYPAYTIVLGGRVGEGRARLAQEIGRVSARALPGFIFQVLQRFLIERSSQASFGAWLDAGGREAVRTLIEALPPVPSLEQDPSAYFDWGATERFSPSRGGAECSAGLFDLIDLDRQVIAARRKALQGEMPPARRETALAAIALSACRMLLVTRSIEAATRREVFDAFRDSFIREELVDARFEAIVDQAREGRALAGGAGEVLDLADAVERLYQGMDDSLRFPRLGQ